MSLKDSIPNKLPPVPSLPVSVTLPTPQTFLFVTIVVVWLLMQVAAIAIVLIKFLQGDSIPDLKVRAEILTPVTAPASLIIGFYLGKSKDDNGHKEKGEGKDG